MDPIIIVIEYIIIVVLIIRKIRGSGEISSFLMTYILYMNQAFPRFSIVRDEAKN